MRNRFYNKTVGLIGIGDILPMPPIYQSETDPTVYVDGSIFDNKQQPLFGVTVSYRDDSGSLVGEPVTLNEQSNTYEVWTYRPDQITVVFEKKGYSTKKIPFVDLENDSNVFLSPGGNIVLPLALLAAGFMLSKKGKNKVGFTTQEVTPWLFLAGGAYLLFTGTGILNDLLASLGLTSGAGGKSVSQEETDPNSAFNPNFWRQYIGKNFTYVINHDQAETMSNTIEDAFTLFNDDFDAIMGVFQSLRTKSNVSYLSQVFTETKGASLLPFLDGGGGIFPWDGLTKDNMKRIIDYVRALPNY